MGRVDGKVAFITGAARGQGRSHAIRLAEEGADIIAVDICEPVPGVGYPAATEEDLPETVAAVEALDRRIIARKLDVRNLDELTAFVDESVAQMGKLDISVINHGIVIMRPWDQVTESMWDEQVGINLKGVWTSIHTTAAPLGKKWWRVHHYHQFRCRTKGPSLPGALRREQARCCRPHARLRR